MSEPEAPSPRRQLVNFAMYKLDPAWRLLPEDQKEQDRREFCRLLAGWDESDRMILLPYSLVGARAECDIMLWRICYQLEDLQQMSTEMSRTGLGRYLRAAYSLLSMTKHSIYLRGHQHEGQTDSRGTLRPGNYKYLFIYPFVKSKEWYHLNFASRQGMMNEHIAIGHKYPRVKLNTTYSFGLDDQEFVLAFESDHPEDFVDLVMELRESDATRYTVRDTPIFTCVKHSLDGMIATLG